MPARKNISLLKIKIRVFLISNCKNLTEQNFANGQTCRASVDFDVRNHCAICLLYPYFHLARSREFDVQPRKVDKGQVDESAPLALLLDLFSWKGSLRNHQVWSLSQFLFFCLFTVMDNCKKCVFMNAISRFFKLFLTMSWDIVA